ncbi:MAG: VOC family protein [Arenicellales bacterium]|nr:VOC family protein [Arenicellales bacterium]
MLESDDPSNLANFYCDALCMTQTIQGSLIMVESAGRKLLIGSGSSRKLGFGAYGFDSDTGLTQLRRSLESAGITLDESPSPLFSDHAFSLTDPDNNRLVFGRSTAISNNSAMPARLQHLVVATDEIAPMLDFYTGQLGFAITDRVEDETGDLRACFLNSDGEHHSFAFFKANEKRLDHHAYEAGEWSLIRDWADHLADLDVKIVWGPGRHGPGNNLFFMINDPDGNWVEISAELEQLTFERQVRIWPHGEKALNLWGPGYLRS